MWSGGGFAPRRLGQIVSRGRRRWLVRVILDRDRHAADGMRLVRSDVRRGVDRVPVEQQPLAAREHVEEHRDRPGPLL